MNIVDETNHFVEKLYKKGLTTNEELQDLIWRLKVISESSNEQLGFKENSTDSLRYFLIGYLTQMANKCIKTEESVWGVNRIKLFNSIQQNQIDLKNQFKDLYDSDESHQITKMQTEKISEIEKSVFNALGEIKLSIEAN